MVTVQDSVPVPEGLIDKGCAAGFEPPAVARNEREVGDALRVNVFEEGGGSPLAGEI